VLEIELLMWTLTFLYAVLVLTVELLMNT